MDNKVKYGQFYTTESNYILKNFEIPIEAKDKIIEPFVGDGDLLLWIEKQNVNCTEFYDIEPKVKHTIKQDTLKNPPSYDDKYIITNPPYLARNKNSQKELYNLYGCNDLYKCFLKSFMNSNCLGGILILPVNFWCSIRKMDIDLRESFIKKFFVKKINIFENDVFNDTKYNICCFQFEKRNNKNFKVLFEFLPSKKQINIDMNEKNQFSIGGELFNLNQNKNVIVSRLTKNNENDEFKTNILLKAIDDPNERINLKISNTDYIDKTENLSARSYATLCIKPKLNIKQQNVLVKTFNTFLDEKRKQYNSFFLSNYRENSRKRISFRQTFEIINFLLHTSLSIDDMIVNPQ